MENIQRNLEKEIVRQLTPRRRKKQKKWTLMVIGDHGRVIPVRNFLGILFALFFVLVVMMIAAFSLYMFYKSPMEENKALHEAHEIATQKIKALRNEKDILMAKLVIAQTKFEKRYKATKKKQPKKKKAERPPVKPVVKTKPVPISADIPAMPFGKEYKAESAIDPLEKTSASVPAKIETPAVNEKILIEEPSKPAWAPTRALPVVTVEKFETFFSKDDGVLKAQFRIRNIREKPEPVSGYAFVVLKNDNPDRIGWLLLPRGELISGRPSQVKKGRYFSIARFRTVRFNTKTKDPLQYKNATVIIFGSKKELLLEEDIPVNIQTKETPAVSE